MTAFVLPAPDARTPRFAEVGVPRIAPHEILVRIHAVGVGIHDSYFLPPEPRYPYPIGIEAAGVITEVGAAVADWAPGRRVALISALQPKGGVWARYAAVDAAALILPIPDGMAFTEAAAVPVAGNTALRALRALPAASPGDTLFVAGGSGAIGTFLLPLARARGWETAASASARNHDHLRASGTTLEVDYTDPDWVDHVRRWRPDGVAAAIAIQPGTTADCGRVVRPGGTVVTVSGDPDRVPGVRVTGIDYQAEVYDDLVQLMADIVAGRAHLELETVYPFAEAAAALQAVGTRRARGKSVLSLE